MQCFRFSIKPIRRAVRETKLIYSCTIHKRLTFLIYEVDKTFAKEKICIPSLLRKYQQFSY